MGQLRDKMYFLVPLRKSPLSSEGGVDCNKNWLRKNKLDESRPSLRKGAWIATLLKPGPTSRGRGLQP